METLKQSESFHSFGIKLREFKMRERILELAGEPIYSIGVRTSLWRILQELARISKKTIYLGV